MEVRDAVRSGKTTAVVPTGGIEQSGPYLPLGKHNFILEATMKLLAERLGDTLIAPIVKYVPEGNISPPTGHMAYAGTISIREETFVALLKDAAKSLEAHGFRWIVLLGDSGDNQSGLRRAADELNRELKPGTKAIFLPEYYNYTLLTTWLEQRGFFQKSEGIHDDLAFTAQLFAIAPELIRFEERKQAQKTSINGISLLPPDRIQELGQEILNKRATESAAKIRERRTAATAKN